MPTIREIIIFGGAASWRYRPSPHWSSAAEVLPERVPAAGLLIPGDLATWRAGGDALPLRYHYQHRAEIEAVVQGRRDAAFDTLGRRHRRSARRRPHARRPLRLGRGGSPRPVDLPVDGAATLKAAVIPVVLHYSTADPLA